MVPVPAPEKPKEEERPKTPEEKPATPQKPKTPEKPATPEENKPHQYLPDDFKPNGPWKPHWHMAKIHGIDEANYNMDWGPKILEQWYDDQLPVIKEITIFYTAYVCGIKIIYRDGEETVFEHLVDQ